MVWIKTIAGESIPFQYQIVCEQSKCNDAKKAIIDLAKEDGFNTQPIRAITMPVHR